MPNNPPPPPKKKGERSKENKRENLKSLDWLGNIMETWNSENHQSLKPINLNSKNFKTEDFWKYCTL